MPKLELKRTIKKSQRGAVIVLFALLLPVLFGFMGLGIDVGLAYVEKGKVQDIADAAALAGAAKLSANGNNNMDAIEAAVKRYVEANGIALGENGMLLKNADKWDDKETLEKDQDALVAYGVVRVTDSEGVAVDRVRVRVTKRVPAFFVNVLGDFSDGFVVVAKAAAEGESETSEEVFLNPAKYPVFIGSSSLQLLYTDRSKLVVPDGFNLTLYSSSPIELSKVGAGNYISNRVNGELDKPSQQFIPIWQSTTVNDDDTDEVKEQKAFLQAANNRIDLLKQQSKAKYSNAVSMVETYKAGNNDASSNYRYIDETCPIISNPKDGIDLYIKTGNLNKLLYKSDQDFNNQVGGGLQTILSDRMLNGVKSINSIVIEYTGDQTPVIDTKNVHYGDIISSCGIDISGSNNHFNGLLCGNARDEGNLGDVRLYGVNNSFFDSVKSDIYGILANNVEVGRGQKVHYKNEDISGYYPPDSEERNPIAVKTENDASYKIKLGISGDVASSGSGSSSGTGSSTTTKLRLVE